MRFFPVFNLLWLLAAPVVALPVINEVQSTNTSLPDQYGQLMDWVEIHNPTAEGLDLSGYSLSDSSSSRRKFIFPEGTTIGAGEYITVWCGQQAEYPATGPYPPGQFRATNFNISSAGETVVLSAPDGATTIDEFPGLAIGTAGRPAAGRSLGRGIGADFGTLYFYDTPTRGSRNDNPGTEAMPVDPPAISPPGGIYASGQTVSISTTVSGATIRYSLDGSEPTESSPLYTGPLALGAGGNGSTSYSWIPTNPGADAGYPLYDNWRAPVGDVARIHVLRARIFQTDGKASRTVTRSYAVDPAGTNRHAFPVVSIVSDPVNLFSPGTGIYVEGTNTYSTDWPNTPGAVPGELWANYFQSGSGWERSSHVEFFEKDGSSLLEGAIGLRINGNTTRSRPRKGLRIYNRNPAGSTTWTNTALFPDRETRSWDTFLLRAAGNDWNQSLFRDALVSAIAAPTGLDRQAARPVVVYLNGEYWGLHNLRERIDENWMFHRYGLIEDQFAMLEVNSGQPNFLNPTADYSWPAHDSGNPAMLADYKDILVRAERNEFAGAGGFAALDARIDADNFIDYSALTIWSGNTDWPGNNVLLWRSVNTIPGEPRLDGRWRYVIKDNDFALGLNLPYVPGHDYNVTAMAQHNTLAYATSEAQTSWANNEISTRLLRKSLENSEFRTRFVNRFADLLNTMLSADAAIAELDEHIAAYQPGIAEHSARWPTPLNWTNEVERIRGYLQARPAAVRGHIAGKFGLAGTADLTLQVSPAARGTVTVNSIAVDSSTAGVSSEPYPWTGAYFQGVPVTLTAAPKPGYRFVSWSNTVVSGPSVVASDAAANYSSFASGSNGGTGFGAWTLTATTGDRNRAGTFLDNSRGGWGLYANQGATAKIYRGFSNSLSTGRSFVARVRHGLVDWSGEVGFELANEDGVSLFKLACFGEGTEYVINGAPTGIPVTTSPLDIAVTLVGSNVYAARITPAGGATYTNSGTLNPSPDQSIRRFIAYNYSAGSGGASDVFVTSLQVTAPNAGVSNTILFGTNATITPTLSNATTFVANFAVEPATTLSVIPPAVGAAGTPLGTVQVRAINSIGDPDGNYQGLVVLTVTGPNGFNQVLQVNAVNGVAEFNGLILPGPGPYDFNAASGSLIAAPTASLTANNAAVFLPATNAVWHAAANWDTGTVPNGTRAVVTIPANPAAERNVTNNAPTIVSSINFDQGNSAFRNRINGAAGQSLVLQSAQGPSVITVTGTGTGHANIEVAGGVILSNALVLDVPSIGSTNTEYGALRLQGSWGGSGTITKRGAGMAGITGSGKAFAGEVVVEQGVLTFSEPALSGNNLTNYTVQPGGQLRLSSASVTAGVPRTNNLKGPLNLAGNGRSGVPDNENLGVLGALRLETGSTGTTAVLTNPVGLTDSADIHVSAGNTIRLAGPLTSSGVSNVLSKSGGGTLTLAAASSGLTGGISVNRGTLRFDGVALTNTTRTLVLADQALLGGNGRWGGAIQAQQGATIAAEIGAAPEVAALRADSVEVAGSSTLSVTVASNAVAGTYPVVATDAGFSGASNLVLSLSPSNFPYASLLVSNNVLHVVLAASAPGADYASWSGGAVPESDDDADGYTALAEFALGAAAPGLPFVPPAAGLAVAEMTNFLTLTAVVRTNHPGLSVAAEATTDLATEAAWNGAGIEVTATTNDTPVNFERRTYRTPANDASKFLRLKFELAP